MILKLKIKDAIKIVKQAEVERMKETKTYTRRYHKRAHHMQKGEQ